MKVISWNLLRRFGAAVADLMALIEKERPDLLLMQEVTKEMEELQALAGGHFIRHPWASRIHGLAAWSPDPLPVPEILPLPMSPMPVRLPRRVAQILRFEGITFANVHLSHGQLLNRRQLSTIATALGGPLAVIGDMNAVGPIFLRGFRDVGPRKPTHMATNVVPLRLDRCLVRDVLCREARTLNRGPSDHRPIVLDLEAAAREAGRHDTRPDHA